MCHVLQEGELLVGWFLQPSCAAGQEGCGRSHEEVRIYCFLVQEGIF